MNRINYRLSGVILTSLWLLGACSSTDRFNIYVSMDDSLKTQTGSLPSVEVDLIGIGPSQKQRLNDYDVDDYFAYDNVLRKSLKKVTFRFSEDDSQTKILSEDDHIWSEWAKDNAKYLAILVNLPYTPKGVKEDGRRFIMPFDTEHWYQFQDSDHYFKINAMGIVATAEAQEN